MPLPHHLTIPRDVEAEEGLIALVAAGHCLSVFAVLHKGWPYMVYPWDFSSRKRRWLWEAILRAEGDRWPITPTGLLDAIRWGPGFTDDMNEYRIMEGMLTVPRVPEPSEAADLVARVRVASDLQYAADELLDTLKTLADPEATAGESLSALHGLQQTLLRPPDALGIDLPALAS